MHIALDTYNLTAAERLLCETALTSAGSIVEAAKLLGITRHASREGGRIAGSVGDSTGRVAAATATAAISA